MDISFEYLAYNFMFISNKQDFFRTSNPEISKLRTVQSTCSNLFKVPQNNISIEVSDNDAGNKVYKLIIDSRQLGLICVLYYIPGQGRIDIYDQDPTMPIVAWKNRRCVWKNYSKLLTVLNFDKLFQPLIAVI